MSVLFFVFVLLGAILTAALVLAEIFFIPGVGLMGIVGVGGFIGLEVYFLMYGPDAFAIWYPIITILSFILGFYLLSRHKFLKKVALTDTVNEVAVKLPKGVVKGASAKAFSRLALVGTIRLDGGETLVEAESEAGFIDEGEAVYISDIRNNKVFVKRIN